MMQKLQQINTKLLNQTYLINDKLNKDNSRFNDFFDDTIKSIQNYQQISSHTMNMFHNDCSEIIKQIDLTRNDLTNVNNNNSNIQGMWNKNKKEISQHIKDEFKHVHLDQFRVEPHHEEVSNSRKDNQLISKHEYGDNVKLEVKIDHVNEILMSKPLLVLKNDKPPVS